MFARVAILTERGALAETYTYQLPEPYKSLNRGACVLVPFQTSVRMGYVIEKMEVADVAQTHACIGHYSLGDIPADRVALAEWMAERWFTRVGACLRLMLPPAIRGKLVRKLSLAQGVQADDLKLGPKAGPIFQAIASQTSVTPGTLYRIAGKDAALRAVRDLIKKGLVVETWEIQHGGGAIQQEQVYEVAGKELAEIWVRDNARKRPAQAAVLQQMAEMDVPVTAKELETLTGRSVSTALKSLVDGGIVARSTRRVERHAREIRKRLTRPNLTGLQEEALAEIEKLLGSGEFGELLILGVTASGKTEVYLRAIEQVLGGGRTALALVPEIALTVQAVAAYRARFGKKLAVLHSRLSTGEKADEWRRIEAGEASVVLGPRSSLFAPLSNLGIIILDEEHEPAFKQESEPRYHARDVCRELARRSGIPLVLGSATPAVESFYSAQMSQIGLVELPERIDNRPMPEVSLIDMREIAAEGNLTVISKPLREELNSVISCGGQAILFLNRRAYGTIVLCRDCGYTCMCPNCAVSVKFHRTDKTIRCHHCGWSQAAPLICPQCSGHKIASFGVGTQRVEEELLQFCPEANVLRLDKDTTGGKDAFVELLERFRAGEANVMVGTQMLAKGLDFPEVLLVGVINADTSLSFPDFRGAERGYQLLSQVAGRAGRGERPGRVLIQTFRPEHYAIAAARNHDYRTFFKEEIAIREELGWPPFTSVARVVIQNAVNMKAEQTAEGIYQLLLSDSGDVDILGVSPAPLERLNGQYRWHITMRASSRQSLIEALKRAGLDRSADGVMVDIDPVSLL